jgi:hypothetical protein
MLHRLGDEPRIELRDLMSSLVSDLHARLLLLELSLLATSLT